MAHDLASWELLVLAVLVVWCWLGVWFWRRISWRPGPPVVGQRLGPSARRPGVEP